jgi:hypothetical protein
MQSLTILVDSLYISITVLLSDIPSNVGPVINYRIPRYQHNYYGYAHLIVILLNLGNLYSEHILMSWKECKY